MMKFKGTIIITDPCYIIKPINIKKPEPKDFNLSNDIHSKPFKEYKTSDELAYKKAIHEYWVHYNNENDWNKCEYGDNMKILGITHYINESTIYGDWSCTTFKTKENSKELLNRLSCYYTENTTKYIEEFQKLESIGKFCADTGQVAVFLLDEILNYNPNFLEWMKEHDWCVTKIDDFDGNVEYYIDSNGDAHIYGIGNINFITLQTGA